MPRTAPIKTDRYQQHERMLHQAAHQHRHRFPGDQKEQTRVAFQEAGAALAKTINHYQPGHPSGAKFGTLLYRNMRHLGDPSGKQWEERTEGLPPDDPPNMNGGSPATLINRVAFRERLRQLSYPAQRMSALAFSDPTTRTIGDLRTRMREAGYEWSVIGQAAKEIRSMLQEKED